MKTLIYGNNWRSVRRDREALRKKCNRRNHLQKKLPAANQADELMSSNPGTRSRRFRENFTTLRNAGKRFSTRIEKRSMILKSCELARAWLFHSGCAGGADSRARSTIKNEKTSK